MKGKTFVAIVMLASLALASLACGGSDTVAANCPDGWDVVRLGDVYHGVALEIAGSECQCAEGSGFCASFEGQLYMINTVEAAWSKCGSDCWGIPNARHSLCSLEGWITAEWDGQSNHVCARFEPY